jgi:hypothetical protein
VTWEASSKSIANFEFPGVIYIQFTIFFVGSCWYSCIYFMLTVSAIVNFKIIMTATFVAGILARFLLSTILKN